MVEGANFEGSNIMDAELYSDQFRNANVPLEQISAVEGKKKTIVSQVIKFIKLSSIFLFLLLIYSVIFTSEKPGVVTTNLRASIYQQAGNFYETVGNYQMSLYYLHKSEIYNPENPTVQFNLASLYRRLENNPKAVEHYKKFLELDPATSYKEGIEEYLQRNEGREKKLQP
jgi:tetratricopeptide (TPR) repeat protein